ncbi:MAG: ComEC/Rec2 family competence protein [Bdellovibrionaceae bacterium]|nr:ComEC/Rec2 family competence protein [Pseudobdellovibrionaceae bacterium]
MSDRDLPKIYNGLVCGSRNIGGSTESLFISTGLYHLIVVSGSHLIFIETLLKKLPQRFQCINGILLFLFSWMCLLNAPIGRALVSYSLHHASRKFFLFLRQDQIVLAAGLISLLVFPEWITSVSLQLSWMAALCMSLPASKTLKAFLCLLYIAPLLGLQNPLWAFNNIFFIALFDAVLFPFTALSLFIPYSSWCADQIWRGVLFLLTYLPASEPNAKNFETLSMIWNWFFIFAAQLLHYWIRK